VHLIVGIENSEECRGVHIYTHASKSLDR
jgi:hypothetical protein